MVGESLANPNRGIEKRKVETMSVKKVLWAGGHLTASPGLILPPHNYAPETTLFISHSHFHLIFTHRKGSGGGLNFVGRHKFI